MSKSIVIVDYNLGNLYNLNRAFRKVGADAVISNNPDQIRGASKLILPGVGSFHEGMNHLYKSELVDPVKDFAKSGKPIMGICLGLQLLLTESTEDGLCQGLNLIGGRVLRLDPTKSHLKIPQVGWNTVRPQDGKISNWQGTLLQSLPENFSAYFLHSYYVDIQNKTEAIGITNYGTNKFASVVKKDNVMGCQFHPEISADAGLKILHNFVSLKDGKI